MLSGSVGSSKSMVLCFAATDHCLRFPGAVVGIGRLALPRLKETLCQKIREHLSGTGISYKYDQTKGSFEFPNKSRIVSFSWTDKKYEKFRSYELSAMIFEELSENIGEHRKAYQEAYSRVGRLSHVPHKWVMSASNPDSPSHWMYKYFIIGETASRRVYYSRTNENPFLPKSYIKNLSEIFDEKMYRRMVGGEWIEIADEVIYYTYDKQHNFINQSYTVNESRPIHIFFDFNIGHGKPLSVGFHQRIRNQYHVFNEVVVDGQRTLDAMIEMKSRGLLDYQTNYIVHGDAAGKARNTRSVQSDYDIIEDYLEGAGVEFDMDVPRSNPPIRTRHNVLNAAIKAKSGTRRLFVYKDAPTVDEGLRLTSLKKGAQYLEDDSKSFQHITTALGYSVWKIESESQSGGSSTGMISMRGGRRL